MKSILKKSIFLAAAAIAISAPQISEAALLERADIKNIDEGIVEITGKAPQPKKEKVTVIIKESNTELENITSVSKTDGKLCFYIGMEQTEKNGEYTHTFKFTGDTEKKYRLTVLCGGEKYDGDFTFFNKTDVLGFYNTIADKTKSDSELFAACERFSSITDIGYESFNTDIKRSELMLELRNSQKIIADAAEEKKLEEINNMMKRAMYRCELIERFEAAELWNETDALLKNNAAVLNIDNIEKYKSLSDSVRKNVCVELIAADKFSSLADIKDKYNKALERASGIADTRPSGGGGSGSGSSGGGSAPVGGTKSVPVTDTEKDTRVFTDIQNAQWAEEAILYLADKGIINGVGEKRFEPDSSITREAFAKIITTAYGKLKEGAGNKFTDVKGGEWYTDAVTSASVSGLMNGISESEFGVGTYITRQDICVVLHRIALENGFEKPAVSQIFSDKADISDYAEEAVEYLAAMGVVNGYETGEFKPLANVTRAEASKLVYTMLMYRN